MHDEYWGHKSWYRRQTAGASKGSILGHLLVLLFINLCWWFEVYLPCFPIIVCCSRGTSITQEDVSSWDYVWGIWFWIFGGEFILINCLIWNPKFLKFIHFMCTCFNLFYNGPITNLKNLCGLHIRNALKYEL